MSTILTSSDRSVAAQARSFAGSALRGASSVAKTQVLRRGRTSDEQHQQRLDICRDCPGGHATFKADGSLHTCGPMIKSMARPGGKTCGCVLSQKARDVKQDCPNGYWPTIEGRHETANRHEKASADEQRPRIWTPGAPQVVTPRRSGRHGGESWSRRSFLQYGAAAAGGLLLPHGAARAAGADCYTLKDCDGMQPDLFTNTDLSSSVGKVVKLVGGDTCWQVTADGTGSPVVLTVDQTFDDCNACNSDLVCGDCGVPSNSTASYYSKRCDKDGGKYFPNWGGYQRETVTTTPASNPVLDNGYIKWTGGKRQTTRTYAPLADLETDTFCVVNADIVEVRPEQNFEIWLNCTTSKIDRDRPVDYYPSDYNTVALVADGSASDIVVIDDVNECLHYHFSATYDPTLQVLGYRRDYFEIEFSIN